MSSQVPLSKFSANTTSGSLAIFKSPGYFEAMPTLFIPVSPESLLSFKAGFEFGDGNVGDGVGDGLDDDEFDEEGEDVEDELVVE